MESRKVQKSKAGSFLVTLPKSWIRQAGFEKGESVEMTVQEDGSLILNPSSGISRAETKFDLDMAEFPDSRSLINMIRACYMQGGKEIRVFSSEGSIVEKKEPLRAVTSDLIGGEVALNRPDEFIIQVLVDPTRFPISNIVFRISDLISSIQEDSMETLESGNAALASDASDREQEIDRLYRLMIRQLGISVEDKNVANTIGIKNTTETIHYAVAARDLSRMGYHIVKVAERAGDLREKMIPEIMEPLVNISKTVSKMRENSAKALITNDFELANEVLEDMTEVQKLNREITEEILNESMRADTSHELLSLSRNLRRAAGHAVAISDVATNKAALSKKKSQE